MDTIYNVTLFGLEFKVNPVAFTLPIGDGWKIYWYGIIIAVGFLLALVYGLRRAKKMGMNVDRLIDVVLVTTPCAILGARAYYILFDSGLAGFKDFFKIHDGGLAIYGGVIVAAVVGVLMCKLRRVKIGDALDLAALGFLIGQGIGRWGNFVNQEAFGRYIAADSVLPDWWGMTSERVADYYMEGVMVHPCFLYESVWCLLGFVILHFMSKKRKFSGQIALSYGVWYGIGRFMIEGLRTDSLYIGNTDIRVSQVISLAAAVICAVVLIVGFLRKWQIETPKDADYVEMFGEVGETQAYTPVFGDIHAEDADELVELDKLEDEASVADLELLDGEEEIDTEETEEIEATEEDGKDGE